MNLWFYQFRLYQSFTHIVYGGLRNESEFLKYVYALSHVGFV